MIESVQNKHQETKNNNIRASYIKLHIIINLITIKAIKIKFDGFFIS